MLLLTGCQPTNDINQLEQKHGFYYEIGDSISFTGSIDSDYANSSIYGRSYNGVVQTRGKIINGKKEGIWYEWYSRGKPFFSGEFINGLPEGVHNWWHPDGKIRAQGPFLHGKRHGIYRSWYENGSKNLVLNYEEDRLQGEQLKWDPNGDLAIREFYTKGKLRCRQLYENGNDITEQTGSCD